MRWERRDTWHAVSDSGYSVVISRRGDGYVYLAFAPSQPGWRDALKVRYALGESVPRERELIGTAVEPEEARRVCEQHEEGRANAAA